MKNLLHSILYWLVTGKMTFQARKDFCLETLVRELCSWDQAKNNSELQHRGYKIEVKLTKLENN